MLILTVIPILFLLIAIDVWLLYKRKYAIAVVVLLGTFALNRHTEQIPFNINRSVAESQSVRIMEYNVCGKKHYFDKHNNDFVKYIISQETDILVLPENYLHRNNELDSVLMALYPYNLYTTIEKNSQPAIAMLYSRYPLSEVRRLIDPFTNKKSHRNYAAVVDIDGVKVSLYCIHASSNGEGLQNGYSKRRIELDNLVHEIRNRTTQDYMVIGDFNDLSGSNFIRGLKRESLKDAWRERGSGLGFTYKDGLKRFRLDHILVSPDITIKNIFVDDNANYSDHLPLITELIIN